MGKSASHRPRSSGRGSGSWNRGGASFGSVGSNRGALKRVKADGHSRRDSREFTLHAPSLSLEDDDEIDGSGDITPTQSNIEAPERTKVVSDEVHRAVEEGLLVTSPGEVDGSLGLGLHPPQDHGHNVAERVARLSIGKGEGSDGKDADPKGEGLKRTETFGIGKAL